MHVHGVVLQMRHGSWSFVAAVGIFVRRLLIKYTVAAHKFAAPATRAVLNTQDDKSTSALSHSFIQLKI